VMKWPGRRGQGDAGASPGGSCGTSGGRSSTSYSYPVSLGPVKRDGSQAVFGRPRAPARRGSVTTKVLPRPTSLSTEMLPP